MDDPVDFRRQRRLGLERAGVARMTRYLVEQPADHIDDGGFADGYSAIVSISTSARLPDLRKQLLDLAEQRAQIVGQDDPLARVVEKCSTMLCTMRLRQASALASSVGNVICRMMRSTSPISVGASMRMVRKYSLLSSLCAPRPSTAGELR